MYGQTLISINKAKGDLKNRILSLHILSQNSYQNLIFWIILNVIKIEIIKRGFSMHVRVEAQFVTSGGNEKS